MKKALGKDVFFYVGDRVARHIIGKLERSFDNDYAMPDSRWGEIELYDFVKKAAYGGAFVTHVGKSNFTIIDETGKSYALALERSLKGENYGLEDFSSNAALETLLEFYISNQKTAPVVDADIDINSNDIATGNYAAKIFKNIGDSLGKVGKVRSYEKPVKTYKDAAEPNDLLLQISGDRAFGFYLLNVHSADIDVNMGDSSKDNHLMIRYNENIHAGWQTRMQYISHIFSNMGFETDMRGGYLHMVHPNPGNKKAMKPLLREAFRGLVSTTHLNLTFEYSPQSLGDAIDAFNNKGITNVFEYLGDKPEVAERKMIYFARHKDY